MFDNAYDKYFSFSDIEKYVIPNNFRMVGLDVINNTLFSGRLIRFFEPIILKFLSDTTISPELGA